MNLLLNFSIFVLIFVYILKTVLGEIIFYKEKVSFDKLIDKVIENVQINQASQIEPTVLSITSDDRKITENVQIWGLSTFHRTSTLDIGHKRKLVEFSLDNNAFEIIFGTTVKILWVISQDYSVKITAENIFSSALVSFDQAKCKIALADFQVDSIYGMQVTVKSDSAILASSNNKLSHLATTKLKQDEIKLKKILKDLLKYKLAHELAKLDCKHIHLIV